MSRKKPASKEDPVPARPSASTGYDELVRQIGTTLEAGRSQAIQAVHAANLETYWRVGQHIVEFEQGGKARAGYGTGLLDRLAKDLTQRHGRGFSRSNVIRIRQFYLAYPKGATPSHLLTWSDVSDLLKIDDPLERGPRMAGVMSDSVWDGVEIARPRSGGDCPQRTSGSAGATGPFHCSRRGRSPGV